MIRLNLVMSLAVATSAMYLVQVQYESRRLFAEFERAKSEGRRLALDNERLQVEKRAQSTSLRIEKLAKEQLQMRSATPAVTHYVTYRAGPTTSTTPAGETP